MKETLEAKGKSKTQTQTRPQTSVIKTSNPHIFIVKSATREKIFYRIFYDKEANAITCDCPGFRYNGACKHLRLLSSELRGRA